MRRIFGSFSCFKNNEASGRGPRSPVGNDADPPRVPQGVGREDRGIDASGPDHAGRARLPADSRGSGTTGGSQDEASSGSSLVPRPNNGADVPSGLQVIGPAVDDGFMAPLRRYPRMDNDHGGRRQPLNGSQGSDTTGGDHVGRIESPPDDRRSQDSGGSHDFNGLLKDGAVPKDAEEAARARRLLTKKGSSKEEDDILSRIAAALFRGYKDLPDLTDLGGFRGSKRRADDVEALGQSSTGPETVPTTYCSICMEEKYSFESMAMKGCEHTFCACCVGQYVTSQVQANAAKVRCPDPGCKVGFLEPEMCRFILPPPVLDRWGERLCEEGIPAPEKCYCPYRDCSVLLIDGIGGGGVGGDDNGMWIASCPHCRRAICTRCRVPWHAGLKCQEHQKQEADNRIQEQMVLQLAMKNKWQRCPKCGFLVERTEGCNYMKCRCQHTFCYKCAGPVDRKKHSCATCKTWG